LVKALSRLHPHCFSNSILRFFFGEVGAKKKLTKRKGPGKEFRSCGSDQGSAFGNRKLLKKFDQNFQSWGRFTPLN